MRRIKSYKNFLKINETTEFNLQRMNPDSAQASTHVNDPSLSTDSFNRFQSGIQAAMSRVNDILNNLSMTNSYRSLRSKLALEDQDIKSMKIQRIVKSNNINYDVYISFVIGEDEYWGVIKNIMGTPELNSEVFKDTDLYQSKEWIIKIKGLLIKTVKTWLKPLPGKYKLLNNEIICYSTETGKMLKMEAGIEIDLVRSHSDKIIIKYGPDYYNLIGDNLIYFNWWFEKID
jgi:hypothetical protein